MVPILRPCIIALHFIFLSLPLAAREAPPNILLIIADDMGLDASPCHRGVGTEKPLMPTLEGLCAEGLVFDNVWAYPTCSPTRASILTGKYGFRTGVGGPVSSRGGQPGIGLGEISIHRYLDQSMPGRYAHAAIGKWHLSDDRNGGDSNPEKMGIGYYGGLIRGVHRSYTSWDWTEWGRTRTETGYSTTVFTDTAIAWIKDQTKPWFLWLAYTAPHTPFHVPPKNLHNRRNLQDAPTGRRGNRLPNYFAALEALDHEIRRLLRSLPDKVARNTVIIFLGDNGSPNQVAQAPFGRRRAKGSLMEGGIRVPMAVFGPGVSRRGQRENALINTTDLYATIAEIAGAPTPSHATDSRSFSRKLSDASATGRRYAYSEQFGTTSRRGRNNRRRGPGADGPGRRQASNEQFRRGPRQGRNQGQRGGAGNRNGWTVRDARYKLLVSEDGSEALYDLGQDLSESRNLLQNADARSLEIARRLKAAGEAIRAR